MIVDVLLFIVGLGLLYYGAEFLVSGASSLAFRLGLTPIIIGCTVVAFGTSAPELVVSLAAIAAENDGISIGNIVGSNIANLLLILGTASLIKPIHVHEDVVKREYPLMFAATALFVALAIDGELSRIDGILLLSAMFVYLIYQFWSAKLAMSAGKEVGVIADFEDAHDTESNTTRDIFKLIFGIFGLAIGAKLMVDSAVSIATIFEIPPLIIGISIVAIGTSLPELATSIVAAMRGESDIAVGNVVGSNVFNTLLVLGVVGTLTSVNFGELIQIDLWLMMGITAIIGFLIWVRPTLTRIHGVLFLSTYVAYMVTLFIK